MKTTNILTLLALLAIETCLASAPTRIVEVEARQASAPYITFYFEGAFVSYGLYADFRQSVPEDGKTYPISTRLKSSSQRNPPEQKRSNIR